jgi:hypothetical protein
MTARSRTTTTLAGPNRLVLAAATGGLVLLASGGTALLVLTGTSTVSPGPTVVPPLPGAQPLAHAPGVVVLPSTQPAPRPAGGGSPVFRPRRMTTALPPLAPVPALAVAGPVVPVTLPVALPLPSPLPSPLSAAVPALPLPTDTALPALLRNQPAATPETKAELRAGRKAARAAAREAAELARKSEQAAEQENRPEAAPGRVRAAALPGADTSSDDEDVDVAPQRAGTHAQGKPHHAAHGRSAKAHKRGRHPKHRSRGRS